MGKTRSYSYYDILDVNEHASLPEIRKAYKVQALKKHPDRNPSLASQEFQELKAAYDVLSDAAKRKIYDETLHAQDTTPKPTPFPTRANVDHANPEFAAGFESRSNYRTFSNPFSSFNRSPRVKIYYDTPIYTAFFADDDDVFRPSELQSEDVFIPFVAQSPLAEIFNSINQFINTPANQPPSATEVSNNKENENSAYFCEQRREQHGSDDVSYVFVKAPSSVAMANLIAQTILLLTLMIYLAENNEPQYRSAFN